MKKANLFVLLILVFVLAFAYKTLAGEQKIAPSYVNVQVSEGDSLWGIASAYPHEGMDIRSYIQEIKKVNNLRSDVLVNGNYLIIPVYARQ